MGFVDDRPWSEKYTPEDIADYKHRRQHRLDNPTPKDGMNRFKYGERWKSMINIPLPKKAYPHPKELEFAKAKELREEKAAAAKKRFLAIEKALKRRCGDCCNCACVCLCMCGGYSKKLKMAMVQPTPQSPAKAGDKKQ